MSFCTSLSIDKRPKNTKCDKLYCIDFDDNNIISKYKICKDIQIVKKTAILRNINYKSWNLIEDDALRYLDDIYNNAYCVLTSVPPSGGKRFADTNACRHAFSKSCGDTYFF